ncbi:MAG: tRNA (adenosine(37)-N6)-threonylcarbamoyltransferase complex ATPase subunit type 1 TsaE [Oscillospiraceae bacterium]|jgi:tRNA threonylcarbamoyladenosine biosynthesis protein TsaE|nr:tRNA (adenosine(37)-N6)-threonylcarbamoyltransferase complex ATPase subunit type 1 TsaE [Oscillospiraceae bacterium]
MDKLTIEIKTHAPEETELTGEKLAALFKPGTVVALCGELGAGKTVLVRGMARGLGSGDRVTSPTFTIVNEYAGRLALFHFDMYRLGGSDELFDIGWEDYRARGGVCVVEWSENVPGAFDGSELRITIEKLSDTDRKITVGTPQEAV